MDSDELRKMRMARGLSQEQVAEALGVHRRTYGRWELGKCRLKPYAASMIRTLFGEADRPSPLTLLQQRQRK